ncbi:unnamed protein product [Moneuplotes crassus]|uniref:Uncharacterized protein n=1 Tax=Euplotes crassus TaxID=5936 RepID=A0AAD2D1N4_EUPCR|nr:unnamed protein product [Moneuplotes crassus]
MDSQPENTPNIDDITSSVIPDAFEDELRARIAESDEDSFSQCYNKELRVSKDEIPIVLMELNDAAHNYLKKEHYDKALTLLQKSHGILEVISLDQNRRDRNMAVVTFQNMAMCYQRQGMLEECASCLNSCLEFVQKVVPENTISERMWILKNECKLRMQLCAILSQIHKHKEALVQAQRSVKLIHHLFKDLYDLCVYFYRRQEIERQLLIDLKEKLINNLIDIDSASLSELNEESLTLIEKTSVKLLPIAEEILKRMIKESQPYKFCDLPDMTEKADMRNILGFLNQNEWVYNLNIGNVMQISSVSHTELMHAPKIEYELSREAFLEKITILSVAYFCTSTELRFMLQTKDEPIQDLERKELVSEYWHAKSLEIACVFLPSECPLLNHILLSYQKHHAPSQYTIPEDSEYQDNLVIIKPMNGMQSCKYNPIVRKTPKPDPILEPYNLEPLSKITDSLLGKLEENEVKTIITQSNKHTGQNSVVNLKDRNIENKRESNRNSERAKEEDEKVIKETSVNFEDAYDDSAIIEGQIRKSQGLSKTGSKYEESKNSLDSVVECHNKPISNNDTEHLNPSNDYSSHRERRMNVDATTNTEIGSEDITQLQSKLESLKKGPKVSSIGINTNNYQTPRIKKGTDGNDPITMVMEDLEKDPKFIHELSAIIGERLRTKPASLLQTRGNNTIEESSNEQILDENSHRIDTENSRVNQSEILESKNHNFIVDKANIKQTLKKVQMKSSSCNRDEVSKEARSKALDPRDENLGPKETSIIEKHMNNFLDECLTEEKSFTRNKNHKKHRNKSRPSTSLFNKKRKSSGNGLIPGGRGSRPNRTDSATGMNKSTSKEKYRPSSAFSSHYVKYKPKSKKPQKITHQKINVKTRNTRNHPTGVNASFEAMISELHKLKKSGNKKEYNKIGSESFEISKMANSTLASHSKSTNRITKRSNSGKVKRRANDKKMDINNYKMLQMLSKEDIAHNHSMYTKPNPKVRKFSDSNTKIAINKFYKSYDTTKKKKQKEKPAKTRPSDVLNVSFW